MVRYQAFALPSVVNYDKVRQIGTSKSKQHGLITGSEQNRSELVGARDWSMLFAFAFARNTATHFAMG